MLVKILSDIHLHPMHNNYSYVDHGERVCILAGDIAEGMRGVNWAVSNIPNHMDVLYVPGNHEYYGHEYHELNKSFRAHNASNSNVTVLLNDTIEIWGITFAGSTLWTDFMLYNNPMATLDWAAGLNDSRWIKYDNHTINAQNIIDLNKEALDFLGKVDADVLITHYAPEFSECNQWRGHPLTPGFLTKVPPNIHKKFKYHIHGHTHTNFDYETPYGTRVICNPRGYGYENMQHNGELVINI
jgi:predicted phosphohydrolase